MLVNILQMSLTFCVKFKKEEVLFNKYNVNVFVNVMRLIE